MMIHAILFSAFFALPAMAQPSETTWGQGSSYVRLQPTKAPGAVAEVVFHNEPVHSDSIEFFTLSLGGFDAFIEMELGDGLSPDIMHVTVPEGYIAAPQTVSVPEGQTRVITIYSTVGAGA